MQIDSTTPIHVTQTFGLFMQLPVELHYYFLQTLPATIQVFAACACKAWYVMAPKKMRVDVCGIAQFARIPLLTWLHPRLNDATALEVIHASCLIGNHWLVRWVRYNFPAALNNHARQPCKLHEYTLIAMQHGYNMVVRELLVRSSHVLEMCRTCHTDNSIICHQLSIEIMTLANKSGDETIFQIIAASIPKGYRVAFIEYAIMADMPLLYEALTREYECFPLKVAIQHRKTDYIKYVISVSPLVKYHIDAIVIDKPEDAAYILSIVV